MADPGKVVVDLALGGDCLADVGALRAQPGLLGPVASAPTVSRLLDAVAGDADAALARLRAARAQARAWSWAHRHPRRGDATPR